MVYEGLALRMIFWRVKYMTQHFFEKLEVRSFGVVESAVEGEEGPTEPQTIASKLLLG